MIFFETLRTLVLDRLEQVTSPRLNTLEDPLTEVTVLESNPPVQDSANEIFIFFFLYLFLILLKKISNLNKVMLDKEQNNNIRKNSIKKKFKKKKNIIKKNTPKKKLNNTFFG